MLQQRFWRLATITGWLLYGATVGPASAHTEGDAQLIAGDRVVLGTVVEVRSGQARIDIGESQPRVGPMGVRHDKGLPARQPGDLVEIEVNAGLGSPADDEPARVVRLGPDRRPRGLRDRVERRVVAAEIHTAAAERRLAAHVVADERRPAEGAGRRQRGR